MPLARRAAAVAALALLSAFSNHLVAAHLTLTGQLGCDTKMTVLVPGDAFQRIHLLAEDSTLYAVDFGVKAKESKRRIRRTSKIKGT